MGSLPQRPAARELAVARDAQDLRGQIAALTVRLGDVERDLERLRIAGEVFAEVLAEDGPQPVAHEPVVLRPGPVAGRDRHTLPTPYPLPQRPTGYRPTQRRTQYRDLVGSRRMVHRLDHLGHRGIGLQFQAGLAVCQAHRHCACLPTLTGRDPGPEPGSPQTDRNI